jgi:hypothetical protein
LSLSFEDALGLYEINIFAQIIFDREYMAGPRIITARTMIAISMPIEMLSKNKLKEVHSVTKRATPRPYATYIAP